MCDRRLAARRRRDDSGNSFADIDDPRFGGSDESIETFLGIVGHDPGVVRHGRLPERVAGLDDAVEFAIAVLVDPVDAALLGRLVLKRKLGRHVRRRRFQHFFAAAVRCGLGEYCL